jgi:cytosine/adenosine deaminase-related metal-dependent hydrolase
LGRGAGGEGEQGDLLTNNAIDGTAFVEIIAPTPNRFPTTLQIAQSVGCAPRTKSTETFWQIGLSPHAPYTVPIELLRQIAAISAENKIPLAMHLAESREEMQWLAGRTGPLADLLEEFGAADPTVVSRGVRPLDYLQILAGAHRALIVHGNYLADDEIAFLADHAANMAVAYCPRTHDYFGRDPYPLEKMLSSGVRVCLGTDGRGSSPDLDLLAELRHVARQFPRLGRAAILELGTLRAAQAFGRDDEIGSLEPGKLANLAVVPLPEDNAADPHDLLFNSEINVSATWFRGKKVWG